MGWKEAEKGILEVARTLISEVQKTLSEVEEECPAEVETPSVEERILTELREINAAVCTIAAKLE